MSKHQHLYKETKESTTSTDSKKNRLYKCQRISGNINQLEEILNYFAVDGYRYIDKLILQGNEVILVFEKA